ncbi:Elicitor peptide [Arabidopsis thaliana x Arabidopsis arenosa]|uniref:Elicitor peptide n=1 Tax=Arabidopsis thaliana x Arabidopsis arenosa TaxID=1240361 RepID=A0A8T1YWH4_9BRAS|nr:Elicitor peptide [Arabidopsis thaliana x Arabidopsis arenosa]
MQQERDNKRDCCKLMPQTVKAFFKCLRFRRSSSSSDIMKAKARNEEKEEASSIKTSTRSLNVMRKGIRKQPISSGKRGGVNDYNM